MSHEPWAMSHEPPSMHASKAPKLNLSEKSRWVGGFGSAARIYIWTTVGFVKSSVQAELQQSLSRILLSRAEDTWPTGVAKRRFAIRLLRGNCGKNKTMIFLLRERHGNVGQQITVLCRAVQHFRKWPLRNTVLERRHRHKPYTFDNYFWRIVKNSILLTTSFYAFQHLPYMIISLPTKFQPLFAIINVLLWETKRFSWDRHPMSNPMSHPMSYPTYVVTGAPPCGNLTGPLRDTYGTAGDRFGKPSRVDETMNLLHKTDMILVKLYRASARWT